MFDWFKKKQDIVGGYSEIKLEFTAEEEAAMQESLDLYASGAPGEVWLIL
jgi:hypothetical protein